MLAPKHARPDPALSASGKKCSAGFRLALRQDPDDPGPTAHVQSSGRRHFEGLRSFRGRASPRTQCIPRFLGPAQPSGRGPRSEGEPDFVQAARDTDLPVENSTMQRTRALVRGLFTQMTETVHRRLHAQLLPSVSTKGTLPGPRDPCHVGLRGGPGRAATLTREARLCERKSCRLLFRRQTHFNGALPD